MIKMCEYCKETNAMEGYPVCYKCFVRASQWGTPAQKQRMKYYEQKEKMQNDPEFKEKIMAKRREAARKYMQKEETKEKRKIYQQNHKEQIKLANKKYRETHKEQWNAYQRKYQQKKRDEFNALKQEYERLKKELDEVKI